MADFKIVSFLQYLEFFQAVFCTEQLEITFTIDFDMFFGILIIDPKWRLCKGYRLCILGWPIFKIVSFLEYLVFFQAVFCTEQLEITFTQWPFLLIFKMVSFPIFLFFGAGFLHRRTVIGLKSRFWHVFSILIFYPNWLFCKSYSLCIVAFFVNFQNSLIFPILIVVVFPILIIGNISRTVEN